MSLQLDLAPAPLVRRQPRPVAATKPPAADYRPAIDGLRAVAVLAVVVFHLDSRWLPGGFVGVDVFFVISGYLITGILLRDASEHRFSFAKFYQRRIARLFPAFFTVAAATLLAAWLIYSPQDLASCGANLAAASLSIANLKFISQGNYFAISPDAQPLLHFWSLAVEEQFYMVFPMVVLGLSRRSGRQRTAALALLFVLSLAACIATTRWRPVWAFYLLPTRAWELLAGGMLASTSVGGRVFSRTRLWDGLAAAGLAVVAGSMLLIVEGPMFPGWVALLPVMGTVAILGPRRVSTGWAERLLATSPMVAVGRVSYSLYLWHWPVFSMVDYRLYAASAGVRIALKIGLTLTATAACYAAVERPCRSFLNRPERRRFAFAFLACALLVFVPLGLAVRSNQYINAEAREVARGGLVFNASGSRGTLVLMGDSHGSMYGLTARRIAEELGLRLVVASAAGEDPLPRAGLESPRLWRDSLGVVERLRPEVVLLACKWDTLLDDGPGRLELAVDALRTRAGRLILITQPPELPPNASRAAIRAGSRPPFREAPGPRAARIKSNRLVASLASDRVQVVDISAHFESDDGSIRCADAAGRRYYHDADHLSGLGADLVQADVLRAIARPVGSR